MSGKPLLTPPQQRAMEQYNMLHRFILRLGLGIPLGDPIVVEDVEVVHAPVMKNPYRMLYLALIRGGRDQDVHSPGVLFAVAFDKQRKSQDYVAYDAITKEWQIGQKGVRSVRILTGDTPEAEIKKVVGWFAVSYLVDRESQRGALVL